MSGLREWPGALDGQGPHGVAPSPGPCVRHPLSVLVVEDDRADARLIAADLRALKRFSADAVVAASVDEARDRLRQRRFDVIVCDFWLGGDTSVPLLDALRREPEGCPVVLVSALVNDDIELIGRRAGAAGFLAKADLCADALDRVFGTLVLERLAPAQVSGGAGPWLRALLCSLDRVHAVSSGALGGDGLAVPSAADVLSEIVANAADLRSGVLDRLIALEHATRGGPAPACFDAVPYLADADRRIRARAGAATAIDFVVPALPIGVETSPTLFGDLVQGFFAAAVDAAPKAERIAVGVRVAGGLLRVDLVVEGGERHTGDPRATAAAVTRLGLVESLARAIGGTVAADLPAGRIEARLALPLRAPRSAMPFPAPARPD